MNVRKSAKRPDPSYPSQRQFAKFRKLFRVAAIGLSAVAGGAGCAPKGRMPTGGVIAEEPQPAASSVPPARSAASQPNPVRLGGDIVVEPRPLAGVPPVAPKPAATNVQNRATYTVKQGDTLSALALRFLGNSNRWREIAAANPGLTPDTLKAGQSIVIPARSATGQTGPVRLPGDIVVEPRPLAGTPPVAPK
jgi:LysM repeat protein